jgi:hypothetical protein
MMRSSTLSIASILLLMPALSAQTTVDYPDSAIASPAGQYPVYTPTNGNTVRGQIHCPSSFAGLPNTKAIVSRVGIQLSGQEDYTTFVVRAGVSPVSTMTNSWTQNLPDQRVQADLSGTKLMGGMNGSSAVNIWYEFELNYPFLYNPGDNLIVDITAKSKVAGTFCRSAIGSGVPRALDTSYTATSAGPTAVYTSGGIKLRFVFQPIQGVIFGKGCPGTGNFTPQISVKGTMQLASPVIISMNNGLGGATTLSFLGILPLIRPLPLGGGCELLVSPDIISVLGAAGSGPGNGAASVAFAVPNDPNLKSGVLSFQWAQLDQGSGALVPFTFSDGAKIVIN